MFVKPDLMPHQIRITEINVEPLQNITEEDCLKEGIYECIDFDDCERGFGYDDGYWYATPLEAFAALIDKVYGKGTWQRNPFVFAYTFELLK